MSTINKPLVSVICITYNHESFIYDCLISILNQSTSFSYELIIGNDCSSDQTSSIINSIIQNNSNLNVNIAHIENKYNLGIDKNFFKCLSTTRGKYIALCEGDDIWIDPFKLEKQVHVLNTNKNIGLVFNKSLLINSQGKRIGKTKKVKKAFSPFEIAKSTYSPTSSLMFVKKYSTLLPSFFKSISIFDYPFKLYYMLNFKFVYIDEFLSSYRTDNPTSWSSRTSKSNEKKNIHRIKRIRTFQLMNKHYKYRFNNDFTYLIIYQLVHIISTFTLVKRFKYLFKLIQLTVIRNLVNNRMTSLHFLAAKKLIF